MEFFPLPIPGAWEVRLAPRADHRGYFMRTWDARLFRDRGLHFDWLQENESRTEAPHTIRGLHFQRPPFAETKLVRAVAGRVFDVIVDLREESPARGRWTAVEISAERKNAVLVPRGCAHGFCTLTEGAVVVYKVDSVYSAEHEGGVRWNDPDLAIEWPAASPILSDRDRNLPLYRELGNPFPGGLHP